jgi:2-dehydropantoate 2-reductase
MRILVLGAGGIGGYYGARIHNAGGDVTFLVRPLRAQQLRQDGLQVVSPLGDVHITPKVLTSDTLKEHFDVIIVSCKAYDLDSAMEAIAPAVGEHSVVLPLLNGVAHIERLVSRFGTARVLGGVALISVTLAADGEIRHLNKLHRFVTGARSGQRCQWLAPLSEVLSRSGFDFALSDNIEQVMWDKFVFLTTLAGSTCLMRASVGSILQTLAGEGFITGLLAECTAIAVRSGQGLADAQLAAFRGQLTEKGSALMASMLRDVEKGGPTEAEHILGDMVARAQASGIEAPLLQLAYSHLQAYDLRRLAAAG